MPEPAPTHPVDALPPIGRLLPLGLQHVLVMYASTVAVPFIVAAGLDLPPRDIIALVAADLLLCGLGTLLQSIGIWRVGARMPLVIGAAYNSVLPMILIGTHHDVPTMYGAVLASGAFMFLFAPVFGRLLRFFPPVVVGTTITLIGLTLVPAGARLVFGDDGEEPTGPAHIALGLATLAIVVLLYRFLPPTLGQMAILIAMTLATGLALALGLADFTGLTDNGIVRAPDLLHFGPPAFDPVACLSLMLIQLVLMVETAGQVLAVGDAVGRTAGPARVAAALRADGLVTALGGILQSFVYITFTQNIGVVTLTGVRSRWVTATAGAILVVLSLFPVVGAIVAGVPEPVLGGATLAMFATVAVIGIRMLTNVPRDTPHLVIIAVSLGVGLIPMGLPGAYAGLPDAARMFLDNGVATGALCALLLNLLFHHLPSRRPATPPGDPQ